jgi:hypothetical protein
MCRDFLKAVLSICHHAALNAKLRKQWDEHKSLFAEKWYAAMERRTKILDLDIEHQGALSVAWSDRGLTAKQAEAAQRDLHLVEAAMLADAIVVSLDKRASEFLKKALCCEKRFAKLCWINPEAEPDAVFEWLNQGAKAEKRWRLCASD